MAAAAKSEPTVQIRNLTRSPIEIETGVEQFGKPFTLLLGSVDDGRAARKKGAPEGSLDNRVDVPRSLWARIVERNRVVKALVDDGDFEVIG